MVLNHVSPDMMNTDFQQFGIFGEYVTIYEMTVECYGSNSLREFIQGTLETFGCKVWAHCGVNWYGFYFDSNCETDDCLKLF
jgi:hypothetical protein